MRKISLGEIGFIAKYNHRAIRIYRDREFSLPHCGGNPFGPVRTKRKRRNRLRIPSGGQRRQQFLVGEA